MESQDRSNRNLLYFLLGVAAGTAAGWYLNSDTGRKVRRQSAEKITDLSHKAVDSAQHMAEKSTAYAEELASKAHSAVANARQDIENAAKQKK